MSRDELRHEIDANGITFKLAACCGPVAADTGPHPAAAAAASAAGGVVGVLGVQPRAPDPGSPVASTTSVDPEVVLIRHAYVAPSWQCRGVGTTLLRAVLAEHPARCPVLMGTWAASERAIAFYQHNGFRLVEGPAEGGSGGGSEKDRLLRLYWFRDGAGINSGDDPYRKRQMDASVVLGNAAWFHRSATWALVPAAGQFEVPGAAEHPRFRLRMLAESDAARDLLAVLDGMDAATNRSRLQSMFADHDDWPHAAMTEAENATDLRRHQAEFERRFAFAYTVTDPADTETLGCVYINPPTKAGFEAEVILWIRDSLHAELEPELCGFVQRWVSKRWPFAAGSVAFPGRDIPWSQWAGLPAGTAVYPRIAADAETTVWQLAEHCGLV